MSKFFYSDKVIIFWVIRQGDLDVVLSGIGKHLYDAYNSSEETGIVTKYTDFTSLFKTAEDIESFLFFTDPHVMGSNGTYNTSTVKKLTDAIIDAYKKTPTSYVVCGGDWLNNHDTQDQACSKLGFVDGLMRSSFPYYPLLGNHDTNYQGYISDEDHTRGDLPQSAINALLFRQNSSRAYYEFKGENSLNYVFDSGIDWEYAMNEYRWQQVDWFANAVKSNDDPHGIVWIHIGFTDISEHDPAEKSAFITEIAKIIYAYNNRQEITLNNKSYDFTSCEGKIWCIICGHTHSDMESTIGGVPIVATINAFVNSTPSFDLCVIDFSAEKLYMVRIGEGNNRTINL